MVRLSALDVATTVFVDDRPVNVDAADRLGFRAVHRRHLSAAGAPGVHLG
jgi:HAD superfamily hydrolase (TIGR01509 family)